jgi:hypothetical protein
MKATATDIHARGAYNGTSWSPEDRESGQIQDYLGHMAGVEIEFTKWRTAENAEALDADLEEYRSRYAAKLNAYLAAHSRVVSQWITGPSGWTGRMVRANNKKNDTVDKRRSELLEYDEKQLARLRRIYDPRARARAAISSDAPDAIERLLTKIERAEHFQELMKEANIIIRKKIGDEEKVAYLLELEGVSETTARKLLLPDFAGRKGFADYQLTNNGANIRRMKDRVAELQARDAERAAQTEDVEREVNGVRYVENTDANRVQLIFPGKPAEAVRDLLKSYGFRWAPSEGAWQRQLNGNGRYAAETVLQRIALAAEKVA